MSTSATPVRVATFLDALVASLREATRYNHNAEVAPAAVLWPDPAGEWEPLIPRLRDLLPILTPGKFDPAEGTGPAAWVRCMVAGVLNGPTLDGATAVVYLPGWSVRRLLAAGDYPRPLQLLAELPCRSTIWCQPDGQDWAVCSFVRRKVGGLGVAVQEGDRAHRAALSSLAFLADQPVADLQANAPLKAIDFEVMGRSQVGAAATDLKALIAGGESDRLEFKATGRYNMVPVPGTSGKGQPVERRPGADPNLEREIWKAVGGFLNSSHGGTLLIGVEDDGSIRSLNDDYSVTRPSRSNQSPEDAFVLFVMGLLVSRFGKRVVACVSVRIEQVDGKDICRIDVRPAHWPAWAIEGKQGEDANEVFYLRSSNSTHKLPLSQAMEYIRTRWPA